MDDWVNVQLTAAGEALAGEGELVIAGPRYEFRFRAGQPLRVTRAFDWGQILQHETHDGQPVFEVVEETVQG